MVLSALNINIKQVLLSFFVFFILACAPLNDANLERNDTDFAYDKWWQKYDNQILNDFVDTILKNNSEIQMARLNLLSSLASYDLAYVDLFPTADGSLGASSTKNYNPNNTSNSFSGSLSVSYELDIYGKIRDNIASAEFSARASAYELESLKLTLINSNIDAVLDLVYANEVSKLLSDYVENLELARELYALKYELGKIPELDLLNLENSLLNARQSLLSNEQSKELIIKGLKDSLAFEKDFDKIASLNSLSFSDFKESELNFDINLQDLSNRPDIKSALNSLKSAFKDLSVVEKSIYPSINLGGTLNTNDSNNGSFSISSLGGNLRLSLPFLDYARIRQNIKISQYAYEGLKVQYEQSLQSAINEFIQCKADYAFYEELFKNIILINKKQEKIKNTYALQYEAGKVELKDFLDAQNSYINSHRDILSQKLNLLKTRNLYYKITTFSSSTPSLNKENTGRISF